MLITPKSDTAFDSPAALYAAFVLLHDNSEFPDFSGSDNAALLSALLRSVVSETDKAASESF